MKKLSLAALLPILAFFTALPTLAQATRTWVSGVGDDANPCSRTAPCKTFAGAISKTASFGEIDALDPGGYGAVTITKSITIDGGPFAGGINASGTNGIVVNAAGTDVVTIRNLNIECLGSTCTNGINVLNAKALHLQHVDIGGAFNNGVNVTSATTLYADGITVHDVAGAGINFAPSAAANASVLNSTFENNANGVIAAERAKMTITDSIAAGNSSVGFLAQANAAAATISLVNSTAAFNTVAGIQANGPGAGAATIRISGFAASSNGAAISTSGTGAVYSFKNNPITGVGAPTGTVTLQ